MQTQTFNFVITVALLCVVGVNSQASTTPAASATPATSAVPAPVAEAWKKFTADYEQMKQAGKMDDAKLIANIKSFADAVSQSAPQFQDKVKQMQAALQAAAPNGTPNPEKVKEVAKTVCDFVEANYPSLKQAAKPKA